MPMGPRNGSSGSKGYSIGVVVALCAASFIAGHYLPLLAGLPAPDDAKPTTKNSLRRSALELRKELHGQQQDGPLLQEHAPDEISTLQQNVRTFDDAVDASGLLKHKPPVTVGDSGRSEYVTQPMQLLSWYPRAYILPGFLDDERADHVVKLAEARLAPSGLALRKGDTMEGQRDVRTSQGTFISRHEDPVGVLSWVEEKTAALTGIPSGHGEAFNVLRYENGQHYDAHYDVFDPESYGPQQSQRVATLLFYLTDVEEGGETIFPLEGKDGLARLRGIDYKDCSKGLKYKPRKGDALLFYSVHPNGTFDKHALHGGCPVIRGTKFVATKWLRDSCLGHC